MTRKHNNILRQIGKLGLITPACVVLLSVKSRSTHQSAFLSDYMSNTTTEAHQPQTKTKKPRFAKILPHVVLACNKAKKGALKDIAVYLALHSFKPDWKYNNPHIEQTTGLNRHTVTKYLQLLAKIKVLEQVEETSCRNTKYWVLNHAKYTELFETEPDNADTSPLVRALQLSNQWTTEHPNQLSNQWTVSCPISDIQLSNQQPSVVYPVDNSISRYKVEKESKKEHKDSVCVLSRTLSKLANADADEFSSTDANASSAVLATDKPEPAASATEGNASDLLALDNRSASTTQLQASNGSFSPNSDVLTAVPPSIDAFGSDSDCPAPDLAQDDVNAKADRFLAYVEEMNGFGMQIRCSGNLPYLAHQFFESNFASDPGDVADVLDAGLSFASEFKAPEEGFDRCFYSRRCNNLAYFFKYYEKVASEVCAELSRTGTRIYTRKMSEECEVGGLLQPTT